MSKDSEAFEQFIIENNLWDVPLQDNHYTWFGPYNRKSRIDRALVNWWWPSYNSRRLLEDNKKHFDHIPFLFQIKQVDWGHIPFKAFNFWLEDAKFKQWFRENYNSVAKHNHSVSSFNSRRSIRYWIKQ